MAREIEIPILGRLVIVPEDMRFFVVCENAGCGKNGLLYVATEDNAPTRAVAEITYWDHKTLGAGHQTFTIELKQQAGSAAVEDREAFFNVWPFHYLRSWDDSNKNDS